MEEVGAALGRTTGRGVTTNEGREVPLELFLRLRVSPLVLLE
jgi:hypothetical protein